MSQLLQNQVQKILAPLPQSDRLLLLAIVTVYSHQPGRRTLADTAYRKFGFEVTRPVERAFRTLPKRPKMPVPLIQAIAATLQSETSIAA
jgi:hypothetical protein